MNNAFRAVLGKRVIGICTALDWIESGIDVVPRRRTHRRSLKALRESHSFRCKFIYVGRVRLSAVAADIAVRAVVGNYENKIGLSLFAGAEMSPGGRNIIGLPSRNAKGKPNIVVMMRNLRNQFHMRESIDAVVTEYGIANLKWRTIRERAQALIDIAHPDDRKKLVEDAKARKIIFQDQIFLSDSARLYPSEAVHEHVMKNDLLVRFRPIKPSDEEAMRRLFYRFSKQSIYRRFFFPVSTMPHTKMQAYVNVDYHSEMSIVALINEPGQEIIIAEARYARDEESGFGDVAFFVDEKYQGLGIAQYLYDLLIRLAKERGLDGFTAEVLQENKGMLKVFERGGLPMEALLKDGVYKLRMPFNEES